MEASKKAGLAATVGKKKAFGGGVASNLDP